MDIYHKSLSVTNKYNFIGYFFCLLYKIYRNMASYDIMIKLSLQKQLGIVILSHHLLHSACTARCGNSHGACRVSCYTSESLRVVRHYTNITLDT